MMLTQAMTTRKILDMSTLPISLRDRYANREIEEHQIKLVHVAIALTKPINWHDLSETLIVIDMMLNKLATKSDKPRRMTNFNAVVIGVGIRYAR